MDGYKRNGSPESSVWKTGIDNFQGYMRAKFEDFEKEQLNQWKEHRAIKERVVVLENRGQMYAGAIAIIVFLMTVLAVLVNMGWKPF